MREGTASGDTFTLRGGWVVDGTGAPGYAADVTVAGGKIIDLTPPGTRVDGGRDIDVTGQVVSPGFIDMHAHSDLAVLADPDHSAKVAQGITLEVVGQDGLAYSPVTDETMAMMRSQLAGWNGTPPLDYEWRSVAEYLALVDRGSPVNVAALVPHGTVRASVMGAVERAATDDELKQIQKIVAAGLRDGAFGMSTGLTYAPGSYASDDELVDALGAVRAIGGYYCPHHRNYGLHIIDGYVDSIAIARRAKVPLHLAHCHVNFPINRGRAHEVLAAIDSALAEGISVSLDTYPYLAGATYLSAMLPGWAQSGGAEATLARLRDPVARERILHAIEVEGSDGMHGVPIDWSTIRISSVIDTQNNDAIGKSVEAVAKARQKSPGEVFVQILLSDELATGCLVEIGNEENVQTVMKHPVHTVGSDGILVGASPHPRGWGTFPRFFGHYARDLGLLKLEEAVQHATGSAANRLGLRDRGTIRVGNWADLVVFDPATIGSSADYDSPRTPPTGIRYVFVNGELAVAEGVRTDALAGRGLRRPATTA